MNHKVTIADFGSGNLLSVARAFHACGADVTVSSSAGVLASARRLVVPGVGAFADSMRGLQARGLMEPIKDYANAGRPLLGICVGMQMLFDDGEEFGSHAGLGLIPGTVRRIPATSPNGLPHKVPHIGWNQLRAVERRWEGTILADIPEGAAVYFVHSYTGHPARQELRLADADYNGCQISAVVAKELLFGCQFHPEKSGKIGLSILENFLRME